MGVCVVMCTAGMCVRASVAMRAAPYYKFTSAGGALALPFFCIVRQYTSSSPAAAFHSPSHYSHHAAARFPFPA